MILPVTISFINSWLLIEPIIMFCAYFWYSLSWFEMEQYLFINQGYSVEDGHKKIKFISKCYKFVNLVYDFNSVFITVINTAT